MARRHTRVCTYVLGMQACAEHARTCSAPTQLPGGAHPCSAAHTRAECAHTCLAVLVQPRRAHACLETHTHTCLTVHTHPQQRAWWRACMFSMHTCVLHVRTCVLHVCAPVHARVHARLHVCVHARACAHAFLCVHVYIYVCMHVSVHTWVWAGMYVHVGVHVCACRRALFLHVCRRVHVNVCVCTRVCTRLQHGASPACAPPAPSRFQHHQGPRSWGQAGRVSGCCCSLGS